jgi:NAD(P)-dependent dehydrogenase (short-subunit alcohol dehydrogenase family)
VGSLRNVEVSSLSKNLADELGPHGINVTVVHPGATRTERTSDEMAARVTGNSIGQPPASRTPERTCSLV